MAFINEKISEADREWFNSFNLKSPFTKKPLESLRWTIDREREAFLVALGGQGTYEGGDPMYYALVWKKNVITMETFSSVKGDSIIGQKKCWKIIKIKAPESLFNYNDEMMELIKEAFDGLGFVGRRDNKDMVCFEYIASPSFIREVR